MTELFGSFLVSVTFLLFTHLMDSFRTADIAVDEDLSSTWLDANATLAGAYMAITVAMSYAGGFVSGGHYNPAVTLGVLLQGKMKVVSAMLYVLFQCIGAFGASTSLWFILDATPVPGAWVESFANKGTWDLKAAGYELLFSFFLVFVVLNATVAKANRGNK